MPRIHLSRTALKQSADDLRKQVREAGRTHYFLQNVRDIIEVPDLEGSQDWQQFYRSWGNLKRDQFMADDGEYRERRYSVFDYSHTTSQLQLSEDQTHYQSKSYNALNGGVDRVYESFEQPTIENPILAGLLSYSLEHVEQMIEAADWRIEAHQFRILASAKQSGKPTPEGIHQDGVDYVFVVMIDRHNVMGGITKVYTQSGKLLSSFKMRRPLDVLQLNDAQVNHYVTAVKPLWEDQPAWRDVMVITFRRP